jgi:hypothetical protein
MKTENLTAPQAYRFPYSKVFMFEDKLLGLDVNNKLQEFCVEIEDSEKQIYEYICEAINEKIKKQNN